MLFLVIRHLVYRNPVYPNSIFRKSRHYFPDVSKILDSMAVSIWAWSLSHSVTIGKAWLPESGKWKLKLWIPVDLFPTFLLVHFRGPETLVGGRCLPKVFPSPVPIFALFRTTWERRAVRCFPFPSPAFMLVFLPSLGSPSLFLLGPLFSWPRCRPRHVSILPSLTSP